MGKPVASTSFSVSPVDYFSGTIALSVQQAHEWLSSVAAGGVNLLAFCAIPSESGQTQLTVFPDDPERFLEVVRSKRMKVTGRQQAFLVQGDDHLGAAARLYGLLAQAGVDVYSSNGVTNGRGGFGYVLYVRPESFDRARRALAAVSGDD